MDCVFVIGLEQVGVWYRVAGASLGRRSGNQNRLHLGGTEPSRTSKRILFDE